ncbi:hypothetical protein J8273_8397 [Carpediemonas membranifera]|uniref:Uncharacterized protein n=1 Tax=Carpediemonas membranifera TaxID=201153 RepID=A0A8J6DYR6_9EUKA|nr:hypothetical protein J8273_8397 [Carpediemonas membranifera]|eukprot:KAG9389723.1 hypothetical protein J8273_8397 [Carpediemonas membranifera]
MADRHTMDHALKEPKKDFVTAFISHAVARSLHLSEYAGVGKAAFIGGMSGLSTALFFTAPTTSDELQKFLAVSRGVFNSSAFVQASDALFRVPFLTPQCRRGNFRNFYTHSFFCGAAVGVSGELWSNYVYGAPHHVTWANIVITNALGNMMWDTFFHASCAVGRRVRGAFPAIPQLPVAVLSLIMGGVGGSFGANLASYGMHKYYHVMADRGSARNKDLHDRMVAYYGFEHEPVIRDWAFACMRKCMNSAVYFTVFGTLTDGMDRLGKRLFRPMNRKNI